MGPGFTVVFHIDTTSQSWTQLCHLCVGCRCRLLSRAAPVTACQMMIGLWWVGGGYWSPAQLMPDVRPGWRCLTPGHAYLHRSCGFGLRCRDKAQEGLWRMGLTATGELTQKRSRTVVPRQIPLWYLIHISRDYDPLTLLYMMESESSISRKTQQWFIKIYYYVLEPHRKSSGKTYYVHIYKQEATM